MGRIGRSFQLVGQSYRVLMQDKELMILPLFSGIIMAAVVGTFVLALGVDTSGSANLGIAAFCAWLTLAAITGLLASAVGNASLVVFGAGAIFLTIFFSALQGVYVASLYRYATERADPPGFDKALLANAFVEKRP